MPVTILGENRVLPFSRTFFNVELKSILELTGRPDSQQLKLYLSDGLTFEACEIVKLDNEFMAIRGYRGEEKACELSLQLVPYGLIYRIEISPLEDSTSHIGFVWKTLLQNDK